MGPSGSGKTYASPTGYESCSLLLTLCSTLLNVLAQRAAASGATVEGNVLTNGSQTSLATFRKLNSYVEQDDALIGSLTVQETLSFAAKLALPKSFPRGHRTGLVNLLIRSFGLQEQRGTLIGTPIRKGISGGQKRRVSVASQLITGPKILFLDELTSGLDSVASYEAVSCVKRFAQANNVGCFPITISLYLLELLCSWLSLQVSINRPRRHINCSISFCFSPPVRHAITAQ